MTKEETIKVLATLDALYGQGKGDPEMMATAWHLILYKYDYNDAMNAVFRFAERDNREYCSYPTVGTIVEEIKAEEARRNATITEIIRSVGYGKEYDELSEPAKALIPEDSYGKWMNIKADEFAENQKKYADFLRKRQQQLQIEHHGQW